MLFNVGLQQYFDRKISSAVKNSYEVAKNYIEERKKSVEADVLLVSQTLIDILNFLFKHNKVIKIVRSLKNY